MRRLLVVVTALAVLTATSASADQYVRGYTRKDGTVVQPYYRTDPDTSRSNNYSAYPNVNPYTGRVGTQHVDPYGSYSQPKLEPAYDPYSLTEKQRATSTSDPNGDEQQ